MSPLQRPPLPRPRGPVSEQLLEALVRPPHAIAPPPHGTEEADPFADEDVVLALYCCYELHYRGFAGVDDRWEWEPSLLAFRGALEAAFEAAVLAAVPRPEPAAPDAMDLALRAIIDADDAPSLSRFVETRATLEQVQEFLVHRSAYLLKEADPQPFAIPRLTGAPKAAMAEIQADEYGGGRPARVHQQLFAEEMAGVGLDPAYGAYLDVIPAPMLANVNLMSLLGLHRRHSAAMAGHLAAAEMTSSVPNRRYANGLRRLGLDHATAYHDEHVVADAVHENIAAVDLAGGLARQDPALGADALWGAATAVFLEARFSHHVWDAWEAGETSLLAPLGAVASA